MRVLTAEEVEAWRKRAPSKGGAKWGAKVIVTRGSPGNKPGEPGCLREVMGVLVGAYRHERAVRLLEDDPLDSMLFHGNPDIAWHKAGVTGRWCASVVRLAPKETP